MPLMNQVYGWIWQGQVSTHLQTWSVPEQFWCQITENAQQLDSGLLEFYFKLFLLIFTYACVAVFFCFQITVLIN